MCGPGPGPRSQLAPLRARSVRAALHQGIAGSFAIRFGGAGGGCWAPPPPPLCLCKAKGQGQGQGWHYGHAVPPPPQCRGCVCRRPGVPSAMCSCSPPTFAGMCSWSRLGQPESSKEQPGRVNRASKPAAGLLREGGDLALVLGASWERWRSSHAAPRVQTVEFAWPCLSAPCRRRNVRCSEPGRARHCSFSRRGCRCWQKVRGLPRARSRVACVWLGPRLGLSNEAPPSWAAERKSPREEKGGPSSLCLRPAALPSPS